MCPILRRETGRFQAPSLQAIFQFPFWRARDWFELTETGRKAAHGQLRAHLRSGRLGQLLWGKIPRPCSCSAHERDRGRKRPRIAKVAGPHCCCAWGFLFPVLSRFPPDAEGGVSIALCGGCFAATFTGTFPTEGSNSGARSFTNMKIRNVERS